MAGMKYWLALLAGLAVAPHCLGVVLNEVMANPDGSEYTDEFVELLQQDSVWVDLAGWSIGDGEGEDMLLPLDGGGLMLGPGALAIILDSGYSGAYDAVLPAQALRLTVADGALGGGGLSNSQSEKLTLRNALGLAADSLWTRPGSPEGFSLERRDAQAGCDSCWALSRTEGGSPGQPNTVLRRRWEAELHVAAQHVDILATGLEGCVGRMWAQVGREPCLAHSDLGPVELSVGEWLELPLPAPLLDGWNPLSIVLEDDQGARIPLLDTLWLAPMGSRLVLEAVQAAGNDWIQLHWMGNCPLLLDGLVLESRGFSAPLEGWLPAGGRVLVGSLPPVCGESTHVQRSLSLALAGTAWLNGRDGQVLDEAQWPEDPVNGWPWRRLDPSQAGDDPANWRAEPTLEAGCAPLSLGGVDPPRGKTWAVNRQHLNGARPGAESLVARQARWGSWRLDLYHLDGGLLLTLKGEGQELVWNGLGANGAILPAGLYLLRLEGEAGTALFPLSIAR